MRQGKVARSLSQLAASCDKIVAGSQSLMRKSCSSQLFTVGGC
jgi:hypothetical protein